MVPLTVMLVALIVFRIVGVAGGVAAVDSWTGGLRLGLAARELMRLGSRQTLIVVYTSVSQSHEGAVMNVDLLGSVALTLSASIVVAILAVGLGASARTRAAIVALFGVWFLSVLALAATETLHTPGLAGVAGLGLAIAAPMLTMIIAAIASDGVRRSLQRIPVSSLIAANTVRVIGVSFLVLHAQERLPASFALTAGWGDIGIGLTAPIMAWFVATRRRQARAPLTIWNALGLMDLIIAISLGISSSPAMQAGFTAANSGVMTTLPWLLVPGFLVPTLAASHLAIFYRLRVGLEHEAAPLTRTTARPSPATV